MLGMALGLWVGLPRCLWEGWQRTEGILCGVASRLSSVPHLQTPCRAFLILLSVLVSLLSHADVWRGRF